MAKKNIGKKQVNKRPNPRVNNQSRYRDTRNRDYKNRDPRNSSTKRRSQRGQAPRKRRKVRIDRLLVLVLGLAIILFGVYKGLSYISSNKKQSKQLNNTEIEAQFKKDEDKKIKVIIDPAKGGSDAGKATLTGMMKEKDINLDIAKRVKNKLDKYEDVVCILTREFDKNKTVAERIQLAQKNKSDIFVSIRVNAQSGGSDARGFETYYSDFTAKRRLNTDSDQKEDSEALKQKKIDIQNQEKAEKEKAENEKKRDSNKKETNAKESKDTNNESSDKTSSSVFVDGDLSKKLANSIQKTGLSYVEMYDRGVKNKNFDVLYYTEMPSVIVQSGFITNKKDAEKLDNDEERENIANGIAEGILNYIDSNKERIMLNR